MNRCLLKIFPRFFGNELVTWTSIPRCIDFGGGGDVMIHSPHHCSSLLTWYRFPSYNGPLSIRDVFRENKGTNHLLCALFDTVVLDRSTTNCLDIGIWKQE